MKVLLQVSALPGASRALRDIREVDYIITSRINHDWNPSTESSNSGETGTAWLHGSGTMGPFFPVCIFFLLFFAIEVVLNDTRKVTTRRTVG